MRRTRNRPPTVKERDHLSLEQYETRVREWLEHRTRHFGGSYQIDGRSVSESTWITEQVENMVAYEKDRRETRAEQLRAAARELAASEAEDSAQREDAATQAARAALEIRNENR